MIIRIIAFCALLFLGYLMPFWLFILGSALYVLVWRGSEVVVIAVLIDAQFGGTHFPTGYLYTLIVGALVIGAVLVRPYMRIYS